MRKIVLFITFAIFCHETKSQDNIDIFIVRGLIRSIEYSYESNEALKKELKKSLGNNLQVHSFNLSGNGILFQETSQTSIDDMVKNLRAQYLQLKRPDSTAYMMAISLGGMIGINWLDQFENDFKKAFIFNSSLPKFCGMFERLLPSSIPTLLSGAISSDPEYKESQIHKIIINHQEKNKDLWKSWAKVSKEMPVSFPNTLRQLWAALWSPNPDKVSTPIYIGVSETDRMVSSECSKRMAQAWKLQIFTHPTAGHDILNDDPRWISEVISTHINQ